MSLKQGRRNRSWASRLLAALFRPFMPEEAPPELPLLFFNRTDAHTSMAVTNWYSGMVNIDHPDNRYLTCLLSRIDYCKCKDDPGHEFLVFYFRHWISGSLAEAAVCVDRTVVLDNGSSQSLEIISPSPSSKANAAIDHAHLLGPPDDAVRHLHSQHGRYRTLCTLTFSSPSAPSALHVAAILSLVHHQAPAYQLYERQCYWYADSVWMSLKKTFVPNQESCNDHSARSRYCGITLGPSPATVQAVYAAFLPEWQRTMGKLTQTRQRHEANLAQSRQEGFAEAEQAANERIRRVQQVADEQQQVADEWRRVADERQRAVDEQRRVADERQRAADELVRRAQAETEQLRAKLAALEGKTTAI